MTYRYPDITTGTRVQVHSRWGAQNPYDGMTGTVRGMSNDAPGNWRVETDNGDISVYGPDELEVLS